MTKTIIGIDLGTTNSEVAVVREGRVEVLDISPGSKLFPSVVGLADDGALLLGETARNQYALYPERTIKSVKRRMGSEQPIPLGNQQYTPQAISALILKQLKSIAEQALGHVVGSAVITVPAYFSDAQRQATREAGELAGLDVARIINEPTAAALAYETGLSTHQQPPGGSRRILVYDLGGGTFDVSVVTMHEGVVEVLASHGNNQLGGDDFDQKLIEHCLAHLASAHGITSQLPAQAMSRLMRAAEAAKITLSSAPYATIEEEYLLQHDGAPVNLSLEISRDDYEAMIEPFINETLDAVHTALKGAELSVADLDEVLLVGGTTRTPSISRRLESTLKLQPRSDIDPELCVAAGAAIQAAAISGDTSTSILVDITPYTFGTSALSDRDGEPYPYCYVPIIRKNTPIPVTRTEVFYTAFDDQQEVDINVYQGEDPDALNNAEIGNFRITGLRKVPGGNPVTATFKLDLDGILKVTAAEKETGLQKSIVIDNALTLMDENQLHQAQAHIDALFASREDDDTQDALQPGGLPDTGGSDTQAGGGTVATSQDTRGITQARAMIEKAERLLLDATADDREDLVDLIEAVKDGCDSGDTATLAEPLEQLTDLVYYLES